MNLNVSGWSAAPAELTLSLGSSRTCSLYTPGSLVTTGQDIAHPAQLLAKCSKSTVDQRAELLVFRSLLQHSKGLQRLRVCSLQLFCWSRSLLLSQTLVGQNLMRMQADLVMSHRWTCLRLLCLVSPQSCDWALLLLVASHSKSEWMHGWGSIHSQESWSSSNGIHH